MSADDRERQPVVICYYCGEPAHKASLCPQRPCLHCSQYGHTLKQCPVFETHRRDNLCFTCGRAGHRSRNCLQQKRPSNGRENFAAMKLACAAGISEGEHKVYLQMRAGGIERQFLLDSGCDTTIVPLKFVNNRPIKPTRKTVCAANGTTIELAGEVTIQLQLGNLTIPTVALVSEYVSEGMIGYDWLQENDCYWGFRVGQIMIRGEIFPLVGGDEKSACCRVIVQDRVVIPRCSETILMSKAAFSGKHFGQRKENVEFVSEPRELENGLYVSRTIIPHRCSDIPIRVLNSSSRDVVIERDSTIAELEPVMIVEPVRTNESRFCNNEWADKLVDEVDTTVTEQQRAGLRDILADYSDCFSKDEFDLGKTTLVKHKIDTGSNAPIRQALRRQPLTHLNEIDRQLTEMLRQGIVEPSSSPWSSNVVIVAKKDGSLRFCVDYRGLNAATRKDSYPLPRIADCLDALGSATYYSTFDLRSGYYQVGMDEADRDKTSFVTRRGTFRFTAMAFGLTNAPATFQRVMDVAMAGLNYEICLVYLDDIVLFSKTVEEHLERLKLILDRLRKANLKLKPSKCHLLKKTVTFLGHVVSEDGIETDPAKVESVKSWPVPRNVTEVRSFLGLCSYYRRFVKDFSMIAAPLHALTGKNARFNWSDECEEAFGELKNRLVSTPILGMPRDDGEYRLDTDASNFSIGAVLSQIQDGEERVIAYASRMLSGPERNYCVTRRELLAVVFFTKYFRSYLLGRQFIIRTDHSALRWLRSTPEPIGQQARWLERLEEFSYSVEHRPGIKHGNADALSRRPCRQCRRDHGCDEEPANQIEGDGPSIEREEFGVVRRVTRTENGETLLKMIDDLKAINRLMNEETGPCETYRYEETGPNETYRLSKTGPSETYWFEKTGRSKVSRPGQTGLNETYGFDKTGPVETNRFEKTGLSETYQLEETGPNEISQFEKTGPIETYQLVETGPNERSRFEKTGPSQTYRLEETGPNEINRPVETGPSESYRLVETGPSVTKPARSETGPEVIFGCDSDRITARNIHFAEPQKDSDWDPEKLREDYENDSELNEIYRLRSENEEQVPWECVVGRDRLTKIYWQQWERLLVKDGMLYRVWSSIDDSHHSLQWIPPVGSREKLLEIAHTGRTGGHLGIKRTKEQLQRRAYWTGWSNDVERYCKQCTECCSYHRGLPKRQGFLQPTVVGEPMERLAIDLTGPHPSSRSSNVYILTVLDLFSKWAEAIPLRNKEAVTVARALSDVIFSRIGLPIQLLSDNGREFENLLMYELCRLLGIEKLRTTAYKASTNGAVERFHRTLNSMLAKVVADNQKNWDELLPSVMAAYRSSRHEATGFSPNFLMFGREVRAPIDLVYGVPEEEAEHYESYQAFVDEKIGTMRSAYKLARENLGHGAERMKDYYDMRVKPAVFNRNTWVYYYNPRRYIGKSPKWQRFYSGPFLIVRTFGRVNVVLQQTRRSRPFAAHVDKLKRCLGPTPVSWLEDEEEENCEETALLTTVDEALKGGTILEEEAACETGLKTIDETRADGRRTDNDGATESARPALEIVDEIRVVDEALRDGGLEPTLDDSREKPAD